MVIKDKLAITTALSPEKIGRSNSNCLHHSSSAIRSEISVFNVWTVINTGSA